MNPHINKLKTLKDKFEGLLSILSDSFAGKISDNQEQRSEDTIHKPISDATYFQDQWLQFNLQREILEAENKALQQKLLFQTHENKNFRKIIKELQDQNNMFSNEITKFKDFSNYNSTSDEVPSTNDLDCLLEETHLLQDIAEHLKVVQERSREKATSGVTRNNFHDEIQKKLILSRSENASLVQERDSIKLTFDKLCQEKNDFIATLEFSTITEQALLRSNEQKNQQLKELQDSVKDVCSQLTAEKTKTIAFLEQRKLAEEHLQETKSTMNESLKSLKKSISRYYWMLLIFL
jgi:hypothetical protein